MHSNPPKIAVVDDDQIYQFIINRTLAKLHFDSKILNFPNCADFFNFLKRNSTNAELLPDLVLLDINTSFMNGWEFLESYEGIKSSLKKNPDIYLVSSSVNPNDFDLAKKDPNLSGFVCKPLTPEQLVEMIDKVAVK
jgi:two-component SAPR family response regulator